MLPCIAVLLFLYFHAERANRLQALQQVPLTLDHLAGKAEAIVVGKTESKTCLRTAEGRIYTKVRLQLLDNWKGAVTDPNLEVVHGGGVLGRMKTVVTGQVEFRPGEIFVLFLTQNHEKQWIVYGMQQGQVPVVEGEQGERKVPVRESWQLESGEGGSAPRLDRFSLDAFKAEVKRRVS